MTPIGLGTSHFPPASAMASVQQSPRCAWSCGLPMQPIPEAGDVWRCPECGSIALRDDMPNTNIHVTPVDPNDAIAESVEGLSACTDLLATYNVAISLAAPDAPLSDTATIPMRIVDAVEIEGALRRIVRLLTSAPLARHAEAVHRTAVEVSARICDARAVSLRNDSHNVIASLEARKCGTAVRALAHRSALLDHPELLAPHEEEA